MSYPIKDITDIGPNAAERLKADGIRTTAGLLDAARRHKDRLRLAERVGVDERRILSWANKADRMRIKGVGGEYADLLQAAGVDTVKELPQSRQTRQPHGRRQSKAQAGARFALQPRGGALDRPRQTAAAQDHLLSALTGGPCRTGLTPLPAARKSTRHVAARG